MCKDEKKTTEAKVEDEKKLAEEELDKASGGIGEAKKPIIGRDGRVYVDPIW